MTSHNHPKKDKTSSKQTAQGIESSSFCGLLPNDLVEDASRRRFLQMTVGGTVAGMVTAAGVDIAAPRMIFAQTGLVTMLGCRKTHAPLSFPGMLSNGST
jgi:hypothetical protein